MTSKCIKIELASGLEARPAAMLVQVASQYESSIYVESDAKRVNAKEHHGDDDTGTCGRRKREGDRRRCG